MTNRRVLALGIDAAESTVVQQLMENGDLPALRSILRDGVWRRVRSPADIGSGSVWPTFISGTDPEAHGIYAEWAWRPQTMGVTRYSGHHLDPFWRVLVERGTTVGMFDVPFAPSIGMRDGFEVCEWGPHDVFDGRVTAGPDRAAALVGACPPHPYYASPVDPGGPHDLPKLAQMVAASVAGVEARGELLRTLGREIAPALTLAVFNEVHHASHYLWQTLAPEHPFYADAPSFSKDGTGDGLRAVYRAVDRQIGWLIQDAGDEAAVLVFSLHGMRPARGVAAFLSPWLVEQGYAHLAGWRQQTWKARAVGAFGTLKRRSPPFLKALYYRALPANATRQLAQPTMLPSFDWSRTRAFALPTDQHGWIRVNLRGRESQGIVAEGEYDALLDTLETAISSLKDADGRPLALATVRTSASARQAQQSVLPDLVVHWADAALASPLRIRHSAIEQPPIGLKFTSQHALDGFCLARGIDMPESDAIRGADLHRVITSALSNAHLRAHS